MHNGRVIICRVWKMKKCDCRDFDWRGCCRYAARTAQWASYSMGVLKNRINSAQCTMGELLYVGYEKWKKSDCPDLDWKGFNLFILRYAVRTAQWADYSMGVSKKRPSVLVLELKMSVLRIINLYFYRTSSQQIKVTSGPFLVSRTGAMGWTKHQFWVLEDPTEPKLRLQQEW